LKRWKGHFSHQEGREQISMVSGKGCQPRTEEEFLQPAEQKEERNSLFQLNSNWKD